MIRCVPRGGVGDEPDVNEEDEDVEVKGVLKWKAEGKRVIFGVRPGEFVGVGFFLLVFALGISEWVWSVRSIELEVLGCRGCRYVFSCRYA